MLFKFQPYCKHCGKLDSKYTVLSDVISGMKQHAEAYEKMFGETDHKLEKLVNLETGREVTIGERK